MTFKRNSLAGILVYRRCLESSHRGENGVYSTCKVSSRNRLQVSGTAIGMHSRDLYVICMLPRRGSPGQVIYCTISIRDLHLKGAQSTVYLFCTSSSSSATGVAEASIKRQAARPSQMQEPVGVRGP